MNAICFSLFRDEAGFVLSTELVLIATICVIGLIGGMTCLRDAVTSELVDVAGAIGNLNQSYCYTGFNAASWRCCKSNTAGSCFTDLQDDDNGQIYDIGAVQEQRTYIRQEQECVIEKDAVQTPTPVPQIIEKTEETILESVPCPCEETVEEAPAAPAAPQNAVPCPESTPCPNASPCPTTSETLPAVPCPDCNGQLPATGVIHGQRVIVIPPVNTL